MRATIAPNQQFTGWLINNLPGTCSPIFLTNPNPSSRTGKQPRGASLHEAGIAPLDCSAEPLPYRAAPRQAAEPPPGPPSCVNTSATSCAVLAPPRMSPAVSRIFFAFQNEGIGFVIGLRYYVCADTQTPPPGFWRARRSLSEPCQDGRRRPNRAACPGGGFDAGGGGGGRARRSRGRRVEFSRSRLKGAGKPRPPKPSAKSMGSTPG